VICDIVAVLRATVWQDCHQCHSHCLASVPYHRAHRRILSMRLGRGGEVPLRCQRLACRLVTDRPRCCVIAWGMHRWLVVGLTCRLCLRVVLTTSFSLGCGRRCQLCIRFALLH